MATRKVPHVLGSSSFNDYNFKMPQPPTSREGSSKRQSEQKPTPESNETFVAFLKEEFFFKLEQTSLGCIRGRSYLIKDSFKNIIAEAADETDCFEQRSILSPLFTCKTISLEVKNFQADTLLRFELPTNCLFYCSSNEIYVYSAAGIYLGKVQEVISGCLLQREFQVCDSTDVTVARITENPDCWYCCCTDDYIISTIYGSRIGTIQKTSTWCYLANNEFTLKLEDDLDDSEFKALAVSAMFLFSIGKSHLLFNRIMDTLRIAISLLLVLSILFCLLYLFGAIVTLLTRNIYRTQVPKNQNTFITHTGN